MSEDRAGLVDAVRLAALATVQEFDVPLAEFSRLAGLLAGPEGSVRVRLGWYLSDGVACCHLEVASELPLTCQRCLRAFRQGIRSEARIALSPGEEAPAPAGHEWLALDPRRVDWQALVEDELLLSLPVLARHPDDGDCAGRVDERAGDAPAGGKTRRPFAGLRDLMKH